MTFGEYIRAIVSAKITNDSQARIVIDLFKAAGAVKKFDKDEVLSESTANKWINGERFCKTRSYFPEGKINNEAGFVDYFSKRPEASCKALQEAFRSINNDGIVDCDTVDIDVFCRSLLRQFMAILGVSWVEEPISETLSEKMLKIFRKAIIDCKIVAFKNNRDSSFTEAYFCNDDPEFIENASHFIEIIDLDIVCPFIRSHEDMIYQKIEGFSTQLSCYLGVRSILEREKKDNFICHTADDFIYWENIVNDNLQQLAFQYIELCGEISFSFQSEQLSQLT